MTFLIRDPSGHISGRRKSDDVPEARLKDVARPAALRKDWESRQAQHDVDHDRQRPVSGAEKKPGQHSEQKLQGKRNDRNRNLDKCPDCDQRDKHRAQHKVFCFHTLQNDFLLKYMNVPAIRNIFP